MPLRLSYAPAVATSPCLNPRISAFICGPRGLAHMNSMRNSGVVELVAACDLHEDRLRNAAARNDIPRLYRDLSEMIRQERPDLVDIVTPPTIRVGIVETAILAGARNILIEKPIALRPSESRRLAELGRRCFIGVNTQYQWMPHWQRFWGVISDGALGEVHTLRCSTRTNILEQGPHVLDLSLRAAALAGLPEPQWVLAGASGVERYGATPVPADVTATIGLGPARLYWNQGPSAPDVPGETVFWYHIQLEIIGSRGRLWVSLNKGWELWLEDHSGGAAVERGDTAWPRDDGLAQEAMYVELRDCIRAGTTGDFPTRVEVAARNSELMFACYASALGNGRVPLPARVDDWVIDQVGVLGAFSTAEA
jgi:predicted dehydrogenase